MYDLSVYGVHEFVAEGIVVHNSSTHQYPDGTMTEILRRAAERGWPVYEWSLAEGTLVTTMRGQVPIEEVWPRADYALTRSGWQRVDHVTRMGWKPTLVVTTTSGRTLTLTPDHRVATTDGWVRAEHLTTGQPLVAAALVGALARTADACPVSPDVSVLGRVLMPAGASAACDLCSDVGGHSHVLPVGHVPQVGGVHTGTHPASVVDLPHDHIVHQHPVGGTMGTLLTEATDRVADDAVPVGGLGQVPHPALTLDLGASSEVRLIEGDGAAPPVGPVHTGLAAAGGEGFVDTTFGTDHVASVVTGPVVPVWDIGVDGEHEFTANGVVVHNCYRESMNPVDGWLEADEVARKRQEIPAHMWETEYDLQEPSFEGRAFDTAAVEAAFDATIADVDGFSWEKDDKARILNPRFITGVDWAKEKDKTIIATFDGRDSNRWECVAWAAHSRAPWPYMVGQAEERFRKYPPVFAHDATGLGNVIADYFDSDLVRRFRSGFRDVIMSSGRARHDMFTEYVSAIESGKIVYPRIALAYTEHKYCTLDDLYGRGHPPDSVVAGAIAWSMRDKGRRIVAPPLGIHRDASPYRGGWSAT